MLDCERASPPSLPLVTHVAFAELCPCGASHIMLVEVHDLAAMMQQDHENVQHSKGRGRYDEEVDGDEVGEVVLKERAPGLRGWRWATRHEPGNGALRDVEPELEYRPRRDFQIQKARKPCRCQRITVSGRTRWSASRH